MKKFLLCALAAVSVVAFAYFYVPTQAGDTVDPLVTRSFVETRLGQLAEEIVQLRNIVATLAPGATPAASPAPTVSPTLPVDLGEMDELFALVMYYFEAVYGARLEAALRNVPAPAGDPEPVSREFIVLNPPAGQVITFDSGTEVILRGGSAVALTGIYNGIPDVTAGVDVRNGESIELNHLMIIPRTDGRGFIFQSESWIMVRGSYTIIG